MKKEAYTITVYKEKVEFESINDIVITMYNDGVMYKSGDYVEDARNSDIPQELFDLRDFIASANL